MKAAAAAAPMEDNPSPDVPSASNVGIVTIRDDEFEACSIFRFIGREDVLWQLRPRRREHDVAISVATDRERRRAPRR